MCTTINNCNIYVSLLHSSPKLMAVFVQYQNLHDDLFGSIWFLFRVYLGSTLSVLLVNFTGIGRIFIACEAAFKVEELNVSIRWSLLGQPTDYEHGDDSYVLSGGLMIEGCHSTSGEPQIVNPPHYERECWYCLISVWWSTTSFRSHSNQNFCLANPKLPRLLAATSCMNMAGPAVGCCEGVAHPECLGSRRNSAKR